MWIGRFARPYSSESLETAPASLVYLCTLKWNIQDWQTCRYGRVYSNLQTMWRPQAISDNLAYRQGLASSEATDSIWLEVIDARDMTGGEECHYESWLIVICTEHIVVIISLIAIVIYINRTNRQSVRTTTPPPPPSPTPAPRPTYTPISSPFNRHNVESLHTSAF